MFISLIQTVIIVAISLMVSYLLSMPISYFIKYEKDLPNTKLNKIENFIFKTLGINKENSMNYKEYLLSLLSLNIIFIVFDTVFLMFQNHLSFIGPNYKGINFDLAFNTAVSFVTNTNLQHYIGETSLSLTSQMLVIITTMFIGPSTGLATSFAFIRGFIRRGKHLGNFYVDFMRSLIFLILPLSIISAILLIFMGVPQNLNPFYEINSFSHQIIYSGPVASLESIKFLGNNGGGFFGSNSANILENPSNLSNYFEMFLMLIFPLSIPLAFGRILGKKRGYTLLATILISMIITILIAEIIKPVGIVSYRFGNYSAVLFNTFSMLTNTGAVDTSLAAMSYSAIIAFLFSMFIQSIPGAIGVGFMYLIVYVLLTLFILGLMVGKMPEFIGMKISPRDVKLSVMVFLTHPLIILIPTALALTMGYAYHIFGSINSYTYTEVLYEFTSAAANNGSSYLGNIGNTIFFNISTAIVMLLGRYLPIGLMLAISQSFAMKERKRGPEPLPTEGLLFLAVLIFMIFLLVILTFIPFVIIGPLSW
ncbi:K+-transporting ATPase, A chain [Caldisphaera lagunensis DSM 15908]|uniref:K+-transporting ATPase, A chain n=1 Tax=Caldisphaera lagunensis (strain DSM 15908 / JCM 11604 / ANMR 0165 / IC-154) TaxID=1056495 RepID=L0ABX1_CALLD|nr:potassium-transporting ATPase subunit KdpA [Caldisphaera lagunensis]AFZ70612.1 K+-transporting ATPase, A chain [Caldisphaera lagunensis DSM 15908]